MAEKNQLTGWARLKKSFYNVIDKQILKDSPPRIARGCGLGIAINFIPTLGLGFAVAFLCAVIFRSNRASAVGTSLALAPLVPVMYALNLVVGGLILTPVAGHENIVEFIVSQYALILSIGSLKDKMFGFLEFFGTTFMLGAGVNAVVFGFALYLFVNHLLKKKAKKEG